MVARAARQRVAVAMLVALTVAACGGDDGERASGDGDPVKLVALSDDRRREASTADPAVAAGATLAFGSDLFAAVASGADLSDNVVVSPVSIAIALGMLEPGATGEARRQLREVLRIEDPDRFHASMNALDRNLEARVAQAFNQGDEPGEVVVRIANAAYLQQGYPFERAYVDAVSRSYGAVLNAVDFAPDPDAIVAEINRFVAEATSDRITDLLGPGSLRAGTVLALVNALYLKASWLEVFDEAKTREGPFATSSGSSVTVPMMHGTSASSARGDGWVAATKSYVGRLQVQFVLPDEGRFDEVAADFDEVVAEFDRRRTSGALLVVPRFEVRFSTELGAGLESLGLTAPYREGHLLGIADDPLLVLDVAQHEAFVAMDEHGTEAAAATVLTVYPTSGPPSPPVPVVLDRPFLFRIFDLETGATLFLGRVVDPTG